MLVLEVQSPWTRRCTKCGIVKPLSEFHDHSSPSAKFGKQPSCKRCYNARTTAKRLGLTIKEVIAYWDAATHCDICGVETPGGRGEWHIDHDWVTGVVRGMLCSTCNPRLGQYERDKKDHDWRERAERYLSGKA